MSSDGNTRNIATHATRRAALLGAAGLLQACGSARRRGATAIKFSRIPKADEGGRDKHDIIEGRVIGALPGEQLVLYAKSGNWWLQPVIERPFTQLRPDSSWTNATHLGTDYAAILVKPGFQPPASFAALPEPGNYVIAVASVKGAATSPSQSLRFCGLDWRIRDAPSSRGGTSNIYSPENAWTDSDGAMHLRISKVSDKWTCAEVSLDRSLGYGTYSFTVRDVSELEPAVVFGIFTYDYAWADQNYGEVDLEIARWGETTGKNAQYVIQPHHVPENLVRFSVPSGVMTHSFKWEPGRMSFRTSRGSETNAGTTIAEHVFSKGVPLPGIESTRMDLYVFGTSIIPLKNGAEVVVEKFEYLP